jgi:YfiH family protein
MRDATVTRTAWEARDGVLISPAFEARGIVAGFTTRALGSMGGRETPQDEAAADRAALARRLGFQGVVRARQVHGDEVVYADAPFDPWPEADALWTDRAGVLLGVVAADCVPVLVADDEGRIGAAHAGWEGTTRIVARELVREMKDDGADPARMIAAVGPSIGPCCYTIGPDRALLIRDRLGELSRGTLVSRGREQAFDLWTANVLQLRAEGIQNIEVAGTCTRCGGADLWSSRSGDIGRLGLGFIGRRA